MDSYNKGMHTLSTVFKVGEVETDPTTVTFTLTGMGNTINYTYGVDNELVRGSVGNYHVDFNFNDSGYYKYSFIGTGECEATDSDYIMIGSASDLATITSLELEDTSNTIFSTDIINKGIESALVTASKYVPREKRITVTTTASKDIDVSNIHGLIRVIKAEYKVDQSTRKFRNVKTFGDLVTMNIDSTPNAGENAYLYCHLIHTPDTLDVALSNVIPKLASAYCAMNWVGDGRTQIKNAIDAIGLANSTIDGISARLLKAINDADSMRTQSALLLSSTNATLSSASDALVSAIDELGIAEESVGYIDISNELNAADSGIELVMSNVSDISSALGTAITGISDELTAVGTGIGRAITDLSTARGLNNKITVGANPEAQLHASANVELNAAMAKISEIKTLLHQGIGLDEYGELNSNELTAVNSALSEARAIISAYANKASGYTTISSGDIRVANGYISEARTLISQFVNAITSYSMACRDEIAIANGYIAQASGYTREANTRLSVANIITSYQKWGLGQYQLAIAELKNLQKPQAFYSYSEY
jgi:hypothetical protein